MTDLKPYTDRLETYVTEYPVNPHDGSAGPYFEVKSIWKPTARVHSVEKIVDICARGSGATREEAIANARAGLAREVESIESNLAEEAIRKNPTSVERIEL